MIFKFNFNHNHNNTVTFLFFKIKTQKPKYFIFTYYLLACLLIYLVTYLLMNESTKLKELRNHL